MTLIDPDLPDRDGRSWIEPVPDLDRPSVAADPPTKPRRRPFAKTPPADLKHLSDENAAALTPKTHVRAMLVNFFVLAGGTCVDVALILPIAERTMRSASGLAYVFAVVTAIIGTVTAYATGVAWRGGRHATHHSTPLFLAAGAWAGIGISLFVMRLLSASSHQSEVNEFVMSVVMVLVYVAIGLKSSLVGYHLKNPALVQHIKTQRAAPSLDGDLASLEGKAVKARHDQEMTRYRLRQIGTEADRAVLEGHDLAGELRDFSRYLIAGHLGDPSTTGVVRVPAAPEGPRWSPGSDVADVTPSAEPAADADPDAPETTPDND